jgi:Fibronectin type III domain.
MGSAGMQTEFRFMFSNGDVYISDTYTIKPQPDLSMGPYTVDLRNGVQKPSGKVDLPNGFPESVAKTIINTIDAAAQFTAPFDELEWYAHPDEDVDDMLAYLDLDDDGSSDLLFTRPLGDSDTVTITPLAKNSIDGDYTIVLDEVARSYFNCRYDPYYSELTFRFGPSLSGAKVSLSSLSYTYSGAAKKPAVTVTYGKKTLTKGTDYTVSYSNNVNAGKAKVTVSGTGKYHGKISKTFTIKAKAITPKVTLSKKEYVFDGSVKKPTVTVKDGTKRLTAADYKVVYASGRKSVGSYKVTVTLHGNYSGSKSVSFKIDPKGTSLSSLTAGSKAITVKWKKQTEKMATTHVTGYEIQLATNSAFTKNVKKVTISGFAKYSRKVTGLLGARKYYVRIRTYKTIGDLKLYSAWSANKTVTTKK